MAKNKAVIYFYILKALFIFFEKVEKIFENKICINAILTICSYN